MIVVCMYVYVYVYVCMYVVVADQTRDRFSRVECRKKIGARVDKEGSATLSVLGGLRKLRWYASSPGKQWGVPNCRLEPIGYASTSEQRTQSRVNGICLLGQAGQVETASELGIL